MGIPNLIHVTGACTRTSLRWWIFHSDEQPELNLENDYLNKTEQNLKTNSSNSIL